MKIKYEQPCENCPGGSEQIIVTREEAIRIQRETAALVRPGFVYESDEQALEDYMAVNWAWVVSD